MPIQLENTQTRRQHRQGHCTSGQPANRTRTASTFRMHVDERNPFAPGDLRAPRQIQKIWIRPPSRQTLPSGTIFLTGTPRHAVQFVRTAIFIQEKNHRKAAPNQNGYFSPKPRRTSTQLSCTSTYTTQQHATRTCTCRMHTHDNHSIFGQPQPHKNGAGPSHAHG